MDDSEGRFGFAVGALLENPKGKILLIKRSPDNPPANIWDVVGGGVEQFENPFDTLSREIREETGIEEFEVIRALDVFHEYERGDSLDLIGMTFWCKISNDVSITLSHEHCEYCWVSPKKALEISTHRDVTSTIVRFIEEKQRLDYTLK